MRILYSQNENDLGKRYEETGVRIPSLIWCSYQGTLPYECLNAGPPHAGPQSPPRGPRNERLLLPCGDLVNVGDQKPDPSFLRPLYVRWPFLVLGFSFPPLAVRNGGIKQRGE